MSAIAEVFILYRLEHDPAAADLRPAHRLILLLLSIEHREWEPWVAPEGGQKQVALRTGMARGSVNRTFDELAALGWLEKHDRFDQATRARIASAYSFTNLEQFKAARVAAVRGGGTEHPLSQFVTGVAASGRQGGRPDPAGPSRLGAARVAAPGRLGLPPGGGEGQIRARKESYVETSKSLSPLTPQRLDGAEEGEGDCAFAPGHDATPDTPQVAQPRPLPAGAELIDGLDAAERAVYDVFVELGGSPATPSEIRTYVASAREIAGGEHGTPDQVRRNWRAWRKRWPSSPTVGSLPKHFGSLTKDAGVAAAAPSVNPPAAAPIESAALPAGSPNAVSAALAATVDDAAPAAGPPGFWLARLERWGRGSRATSAQWAGFRSFWTADELAERGVLPPVPSSQSDGSTRQIGAALPVAAAAVGRPAIAGMSSLADAIGAAGPVAKARELVEAPR